MLLSSLTLIDVLYVPKLCVSLLSINQFTKYNNCKLFFSFSLCISGPVNWKENWFGVWTRRYVLFGWHSKPYCLGCRSAWSRFTLALSLGSSFGAKAVVLIASFISSLGGESCELCKHPRATYPSWVTSRNRSLFELVHFVVWGPIHVPFIKDFRYFLLFVDDFSRITWLYLLKKRLEVSSVIEPFFNEIKNMFSTFISVLWTDNVLEYVKNDVSIFCSKNEIIHQTSYSHTSQQNGIVECKQPYSRCG